MTVIELMGSKGTACIFWLEILRRGRASLPLMRMIPIPPAPGGVEIAAIVVSAEKEFTTLPFKVRKHQGTFQQSGITFGLSRWFIRPTTPTGT
jgi:hypothetical protein